MTAPARPRPTVSHHHPSSITPLRRISHGSLAALSASRSRENDYTAGTLSHLAPVFAELSEAIEDLAVNFEALDAITENLDRFNEGFAGFLYGLRMNAYSTTIRDAPDIRNFERAQHRATRRREAELAEQGEASRRAAAEEAEATCRRAGSEGPPSPTSSMSGQGYADATFISTREVNEVPGRAGGRGRGIPSTRGGRTGAATGKTAAQKRKEANIRFAAPIIDTLPLQYREQQPQRADMETVIGALRDNSEGLRIPEFVKKFPLIPQHRMNDCLLTLVRAKHAIKVTQKGLVYRLDPMKYPAGA